MKRHKWLSASAVVFSLSTMATLIVVGNTNRQANSYQATLPLEGWDVVFEGLGELPMKKSEPVRNAIYNQIQKQLQAQHQKATQKVDSTNKKQK